MHLWSLICGLLLLCVVVFCCVGTGGPQFRAETPGLGGGECKNEFYLYQTRFKCDGADAATNRFSRDEFGCKGTYDKITAAYAFAIMACITSGIAMIIAFVAAFVKRIPTWLVIPLIALTFIFLLIAWPLSESVRSVSQCDAPTFKDGGYDISWGLALLITAWCLSFVLLVLSIVFHRRPFGQGRDDVVVHRHPTAAGH